VVNTWLQHFAMHIIIHLCPRVVFLSRKWFSHEVLPDLVEKTKQEYFLTKLKECRSTIVSFDTWMSKQTHDVFALMISFWVWIRSLNISQ
jgi:hypothetical protein